jgi:uncharacterized Zn finger protein
MFYEWAPYVSVAERLANARKYAQRVAKKEKRELSPVRAKGRKIASQFWGQAWCDNLDRYSDFANRLPRGRRYLGNGSVVDLQILPGLVKAIVAGSETYTVAIKIKPLPTKTWKSLRNDCSQSIHSLLDLLQGRFDEGVMRRLVQSQGGLFPHPKEIDMDCSCPDHAGVCKHIAAVVYGVGVRLDTSPELLFTLRKVDHSELITQALAVENLEQSLAPETAGLAGSDLGELFGINLESSTAAPEEPSQQTQPKRAVKKPAASRRKASEVAMPRAHGSAVASARRRRTTK